MADYEVRFHPEAIKEAESSQHWYVERSQTAALGFTNEISSAIEKILKSPTRWPKYQKNTRRYILPRFPFSVIYRIKDNIIEVIAIAHHKRKPGFWRNR
ncbi:MAG TPA: type II toxin-antitoxin system RelE/ParE family toxin [Thermodesulfobacteriota bacterium]|nr:type II toxin-antitoxin system RelE/ParE family toxin [Thermodesulfobacteriota bacterium]